MAAHALGGWELSGILSTYTGAPFTVTTSSVDPAGLGILSGGIQALRLNFVEMYTKFYKGGGKLYKPFGRPRLATTAASSPSNP